MEYVFIAQAVLPDFGNGRGSDIRGVFRTLDGAKQCLEELFDKLCTDFPDAKLHGWEGDQYHVSAAVENVYDDVMRDFFSIRRIALSG